MRFCEFCEHNVISIDSGEMLGMPSDVEFDEDYHIYLFYVTTPPHGVKRFLPFLFPGEERMIRVNEIVRIGKDVILVHTC